MAQQAAVAEKTNGGELMVVDESKVRKDLGFVTPQELQVVSDTDPVLEAAANKFTAMMLSVDPKKNFKELEGIKGSVETMGLRVETEASSKSEMLNRQVKALSTRGDDGGPVAKGIIDLKMQVEDLDPGKLDLEPGWFTRAIGHIPGIGNPLKRYFTQYESAQTVIDAIVRSLKDGAEQLRRDNITLADDQARMRELTLRLEKAIKLGSRIDQKIGEKLQEDGDMDEERKKFVEEELLFPLRQRLMDLQQTLVVHQQGVLGEEIVIRNNKELIRGVNRVLNTTITALRVAVVVAFALADQKIVLDKIEAVNKTTSDLISHTAERLKTQGVAIHKQASNAMLDMEKLKTAFADVNQAFADLSNFRRESLPRMAQTILELDRLTAEGETTIQKMEKGNANRPTIEIEY